MKKNHLMRQARAGAGSSFATETVDFSAGATALAENATERSRKSGNYHAASEPCISTSVVLKFDPSKQRKP
jgi:hypothetical protein